MGVIFFIYNAAFSTILLIIVLIASVVAVVAKNPDTRYQPMRDDRGSFIKSQSQLTTELDALGATARGESKHGWTNDKSGARVEDDEEADSWSGGSSAGGRTQPLQQQQQQQTAYGGAGAFGHSAPPSDVGPGRHMPPTHPSAGIASPYAPPSQNRSRTQDAAGGPSPWQRGAGYE